MIEYIGLTLIGFTIVMLVMVILTLILMFVSNLSKRKDKNKGNEVNNEKPLKNGLPDEIIPVEDKNNNNDELIAVITAAINAYTTRDSGTKLRVISFKRVGDNAPAWNKTSRVNN